MTSVAMPRKFRVIRQLLRYSLFAAVMLINAPSVYAQEYQWHRANIPLFNGNMWTSIAFNPLSHGRIIFAGPDFVGGIFRSDDGGTTFIEHDSLLDPSGFPIGFVHQILVLPSDTSVVFAISENGFYRSTDGGLTWNDLYNDDTLGGQTSNFFGGIGAECLEYNSQEDDLYYGEENTGTIGAGVWQSSDHGADWVPVGFHVFIDTNGSIHTYDSAQLYSMDASQDSPPELIQSTLTVGSLEAYSTDLGSNWNFSFLGTNNVETPKIVFSWHQISPITGKHDVAIVQRWPANDSSLIATPDGGRTWQILHAPSHLWGLDIDQRVSMLSKPGNAAYPLPLHYFTGFFNVDQDTIPNGMVQETTDGGISWLSINFPHGISGDTLNPKVREIWVLKYDTSSSQIAVAADSGIYIGDLVNSVASEPVNSNVISILQNSYCILLSSAKPIESVRLFDIFGRKLLEVSPRKTVFQINSVNYPHGVYAIEAYVSGKQPYRKLVQF